MKHVIKKFPEKSTTDFNLSLHITISHNNRITTTFLSTILTIYL